jgi:hypothetical protein
VKYVKKFQFDLFRSGIKCTFQETQIEICNLFQKRFTEQNIGIAHELETYMSLISTTST